jgi:glycosyltransferase involved in cell wall biosynthesis
MADQRGFGDAQLFHELIEQFDLRAYDIILSSSYAVAHGVLARPEQLHISFTHTPLRQAWHQHFAYLNDAGLQSGPRSWLVRPILHYLRLWDYAAAGRVDHFLAASRWIQRAIWRAYRRQAQLMYPPVDTAAFHPIQPRQDYFIIVSRLELHKRIDIAVEAFSKLVTPLLVVGGSRQTSERWRQQPQYSLLGTPA